MEEALVHRAALNQAERAGVRIWKDRLRSIGRSCDGTEPGGNFIECLVPADALEASFTLPADATKRMRQPLVVIGALEVAIHLRAQKASREGMVGIAGDAYRATVANGNEHRARIGAVVRAGAAHDRVAGAGVTTVSVAGAGSEIFSGEE